MTNNESHLQITVSNRAIFGAFVFFTGSGALLGTLGTMGTACGTSRAMYIGQALVCASIAIALHVMRCNAMNRFESRHDFQYRRAGIISIAPSKVASYTAIEAQRAGMPIVVRVRRTTNMQHVHALYMAYVPEPMRVYRSQFINTHNE